MMNCNDCMDGAPYKFCCKLECGEHEFCRNCSYTSKNRHCPYKTEQMLQYSKEELNNKPTDFYNSIKPIPMDWSTVKPLPPVEDSDLIPIEKEELRKQDKMEFLFSSCFLSMPFIVLIVVCLVIIFS